MKFTKIIPNWLMTKLWVHNPFNRNLEQKLFIENARMLFKTKIIHDFQADNWNQNHLDLLILNYALLIQKKELPENLKKTYFEFFAFDFLGSYLKNSEIANSLYRVTKILEKYEADSK